ASALVLATLAVSAGDAIAQGPTKDACALIKPAEIQAIDPTAPIGSGVPGSTPLSVGCAYQWGPRTKEWGTCGLSITVIDASKAWPGLDAETIKQGLLMKLKKGGASASQIPGVGDAAVFTLSERYPANRDGTAEAYMRAKGAHLLVRLHGGDLVA